MCLKTKSRPTWGVTGGIKGRPFSKKSMGDFTGSNFEGAHHLKSEAKIISCEKNIITPKKLFQTQKTSLRYPKVLTFLNIEIKGFPIQKKKK